MLTQVPTPLIGRDREVAEVRAELDDPSTRLLTLTGPVGVGKSRLAAAVVRARSADGPLALRVVDLARMQDPRAALEQARPVDLPPAGRDERDEEDAACPLTGPGPALLLLDNCDPVLDRAREQLTALVAALLSTDPGLTVLATSREPLGVYGERRWAVGPLAVPPAEMCPAEPLEEVPSVALFVQRARAASPGFALTEHNREDVAEICRQLDGLPLAVELAAVRVRVFQPRTLLLRLQERLDVLEGRSADTLSRHRTMRSALASGYDQLAAGEQAVVRRLSVFPADFGLEAAEAVVGRTDQPVDLLLESLLDRSIVGTAQARDGEPRFALLRTVRRFAQEKLGDAGELPETYRRLAAHARAMADTLAAGQCAPAGAQLTVPTGEQQAIAEAVRWLLRNGDLSPAVTVLDKLSPYWLQHGQGAEVRRWVAEAVRVCEAAGDRPVTAEAHRLAGVLAASLADPEGAVVSLQKAVALHRELGDDARTAVALAHLGEVVGRTGDGRRAREVLDEAVALARRADDAPTRALALGHLAAALAGDGDTTAAAGRAHEAARLWSELGDRRQQARTRALLAGIAAARADHAKAAELARGALREQWELHDRAGLPATLEVLADLVGATEGTQFQAALLLGAAAALRDLTRTVPTPLERATTERATRRLSTALGPAAMRDATVQGRREDLAAVVAQALEARPAPEPPAEPAAGVGAGPLTPREREVADLITRGMTNRQIARQLGIAEWTAVNHVRHIMRKLECPSRIHVARWMAGQPR